MGKAADNFQATDAGLVYEGHYYPGGRQVPVKPKDVDELLAAGLIEKIGKGKGKAKGDTPPETPPAGGKGETPPDDTEKKPGDDGDKTGDDKTRTEPGGDAQNYSKLNKASLVALCADRNIDVDEKDTMPVLIEKLQAADQAAAA